MSTPSPTPANPVVKTTPVRAFPGWNVETHLDGSMWVVDTQGPGFCFVENWAAALYFIRNDRPLVGQEG